MMRDEKQRKHTRTGALCLVAAVWLAGAALAQEEPPVRPPTGRHAPPPPPPERAAPEQVLAAAGSRWSVTIGAGLFTSGDLFRAVVLDGSTRSWTPPTGSSFNAKELLVTLDEDLAVGASVLYRASPRWLARFDLSWAEADATAEARVGEIVELQPWDRLTFAMAGLGLECRLLRARSYPYALAGLVVSTVSSAGAGAIDQTRLGLRGGLGWQVGFDPQWGTRIELRDTWQQLDMDGYGGDPAFVGTEFTELGPQHLFEILASLALNF